MPRVSVLVPTYNREATLEECLRSALDAPFRDLEVLVADNASVDGTTAIVERIAASDPRVRLVVHDRNRGAIGNWKTLLERASGEFVHWLWSDDVVEPDFYGDMLSGMETHRAGIGVCAARVFDDVAGWTQIIGSLRGPVWTRDDYLRLCLLGTATTIVSPCAALLPTESCRRHFHDALPGPLGRDCIRRAVGPDLLMLLGATADAERVYVQGEPLVRFRQHQHSITVQEGERADTLYAFARVWWSNRNGIPLSWNRKDLVRLLKSRSARDTMLSGLRRSQ